MTIEEIIDQCKGWATGAGITAFLIGLFRFGASWLKARSDDKATMLTAEGKREEQTLTAQGAAFDHLTRALKHAEYKCKDLDNELDEEKAHSDHLEMDLIKIRVLAQTEMAALEVRAKEAESRIGILERALEHAQETLKNERHDRELAYARWEHDLDECREALAAERKRKTGPLG